MQHLRTTCRLFLTLTLLTGFLYPLMLLLCGQTFFSFQANGSLLKEKDTVQGSVLIGQSFSKPYYFKSRPSLAGKGYDAASSNASNQLITSKEWQQTVKNRTTEWQKQWKGKDKAPLVPIDLVTASASGLDPHISLAAAKFQLPAIAKARHISEKEIWSLLEEIIEYPLLGVIGEARINVYKANRLLDQHYPKHSR